VQARKQQKVRLARARAMPAELASNMSNEGRA
jgi:hypothetical protein